MRRTFVAAIVAVVAWCAVSGQAAASPMVFQVETADPSCGSCTVIYATGDIVEGSLEALLTVVDELGLQAGTTVVLNSPGGSLWVGIEMGDAIRRLRFHTSVYGPSENNQHAGGICASACAYALLGGTHRTVGPSARIGLHQFSGTATRGRELSEAQTVVSIVANYVRRMGVSQELVEIASAIPSSEVRWLTASEMTRLGVLTGRGFRFSPAWTTRPARTTTGILMTAQSLLENGGLAQLQVICHRPVFNRGSPTYGLMVTLPDPPGGIQGIRDYQTRPTTLRRFTIVSAHGGAETSHEIPSRPIRVEYWFSLGFSVEVQGTLLEQLYDGFTLRWEPSIVEIQSVNFPAEGFRQAFAEFRVACEEASR